MCRAAVAASFLKTVTKAGSCDARKRELVASAVSTAMRAAAVTAPSAAFPLAPAASASRVTADRNVLPIAYNADAFSHAGIELRDEMFPLGHRATQLFGNAVEHGAPLGR